ncbi:Inositol 2-dehydrogenase/D-chiro-inositol 3-dehydrogenase [subsurface metagenome]
MIEEKSKLKVGVIGCGFVAKYRHIPCLLAIPEVELTSVCDLDDNRAKQVAEDFGISSFYTDAMEMVQKESLEIVHILTPPESHMKLALMALDAGCHVLIEKPFVYTVSEADQVIKKSKETGFRFSVIHNDLFTPTIMELKQRITQGEIGKISSARVLYGGRDQSTVPDNWYFRMRGGRFGETLPHPLCLLVEFIEGLEVIDVKAWKTGGCITPAGLEEKYYDFDELHIELVNESRNAFGYISYSFNTNLPLILIVSGTKGSLFVHPFNNVFELPLRPSATRPKDCIKLGIRLVGSVLGKVNLQKPKKTTAAPRIQGSSHYGQISAFVRSIRENTQLPVTNEKAREVVRLWQDIVESYILK